ncbi:unnamed protein product [Prorocentrum cordatum]|uniref:Myosin motor domain-containing protein n=1 Tax=Prorocentrum cordatum TaxID=2364126 RepID=A0ABN9WM54_9DINO|nr:unnamed protein product [Polarella glacialis]
MLEEAYWVRHPELVWAPATPEGGREDAQSPRAQRFLVFGTADAFEGKSLVPDKKGTDDKLARVKGSQLQGVADVCLLEEVNDGALLHTVRTRYRRDEIYTYVSQMLIAVNPFRWLPIYSNETMQTFLTAGSTSSMDPHIFGTGFNAFRGLKESAQAVLVSGESGAGKTESAKLIIKYVAQAATGHHGMVPDGGAAGQAAATRPSSPSAANAGVEAWSGRSEGQPLGEHGRSGDPRTEAASSDAAGVGGIEDKIMGVNPVLESFGNATTERNNNSSRFGKWTQIGMSQDLRIRGCSITDYLLELTRVCGQGPRDRNYHIFFQLIQARGDSELSEYNFGKCDDYLYLKGARHEASGIDDKEWFRETKKAFSQLGFSHEVQMEIFRITMGVLSLGNIQYTDQDVGGADGSAFVDQAPVEEAAKLFGMNPEQLSMPLLQKIKQGKASIITVPRNAKDASATRDSIARLLYGRLFKWLVAEINKSLGDCESASTFFGVLDIAGFESFARNDLEQLFINYANELLQQHFNNAFFKMELDQYKAEGLDCSEDLSYKDNSDIVELLKTKGGIFQSLDEETTLASGKAENFVSKISRAHADHPRMVVPKIKKKFPAFGIQHFAGTVEYTCEGFLEKNADSIPAEAPDLLKGSTIGILRDLGEQLRQEAEDSSNQKGAKKKTVSIMFQKSLEMLMGKIEEAQPNFIRCVKPNAEKVASKFTSQLVLEQLLYSGVFEAVHIRQSGFSTRLPFDAFLTLYVMLARVDNPEDCTSCGGSGCCFCKLPDEADNKHKCWQCYNVGCKSSGVVCDCPAGPRLKDMLRGRGSTHVLKVLEKLCEGPDAKRGMAVGKSRVFLKKRAHDALERMRDQIFRDAQALFEEIRQELEQAIQARQIDALTAAIASAEAKGFEECDLCDQARGVLFEEQNARLFAELKAGLEAAIGTGDVDALQSAIEQAEQHVAFKDGSLQAAREALHELGRADRAAAALREALRAPALEGLQAALEEAEAAGLGGGLLQEGRAALERQAQERRAALAQEEARAKIRALGSPPWELAELEAALEQGRAAGLEDAELEGVQRQVGELQARAEARERLAEAAQGPDEERFRRAEQQAAAAGLEERDRVPYLLQFAAALGEAERLRAAITLAEELGGSAGEGEWLSRAREALQVSEERDHVLRALSDAIALGDLQALRDGVRQAESLGVPAPRLGDAREALAHEEGREAARRQIQEALSARDLDALHAALGRGREAGLCQAELATAAAILHREGRRAAALAAMKKRAEAGRINTAALKRAVDESREAGVAPEEIARCHLVLALALREVATVRAAVEEADACGLDGGELERARCTLELLEAVQDQSVQGLKEAIGGGEFCGVDRALLDLARDELALAERKQEARSHLSRALGTPEERELKAALEHGRRAQLDEAELREVRAAYHAERRKAAARRNLEETVDNPVESAAFQTAMAEGVEAGLDIAELEGFSARADRARQVHDAVAALQRAMGGEGSPEGGRAVRVQRIQDAVELAEEVGVPEEEVARAKRRLELEQHGLVREREQCEDLLNSAAREQNPAALRAAISQAEGLQTPDSLGVDQSLLRRARAALAQTDRKAAVIASVQEAIRSDDARLLHVAIAEGAEWDVEPSLVAEAEGALASLRRRDAARDALDRALQSEDVSALADALADGRSAGLGEAELREVKLRLGAEQRKAAAVRGLQQAIMGRQHRALRCALAECRAVGACEDSAGAQLVAEAERALALELGTLGEKEQVDAAVRSGSKEALLEAVARARAVGLSDVHLQEALGALRGIEAKEQRWKEMKETLEEAVASRDIACLCAALSECRATSFDAPEVQAAEAVLRVEQMKERARAGLGAAAQERDEQALLRLLLEAQRQGLSEEDVAEVRARLGPEERRALARAGLRAAREQRGAAALAAAIAEGAASGLEEPALAEARGLLVREKAREQKHAALLEAMGRRDPDELGVAIAEAGAHGADDDVLDAARAIREAEARKAAARGRLFLATGRLSGPAAAAPRQEAPPYMDSPGLLGAPGAPGGLGTSGALRRRSVQTGVRQSARSRSILQSQGRMGPRLGCRILQDPARPDWPGSGLTRVSRFPRHCAALLAARRRQRPGPAALARSPRAERRAARRAAGRPRRGRGGGPGARRAAAGAGRAAGRDAALVGGGRPQVPHGEGRPARPGEGAGLRAGVLLPAERRPGRRAPEGAGDAARVRRRLQRGLHTARPGHVARQEGHDPLRAVRKPEDVRHIQGW